MTRSSYRRRFVLAGVGLVLLVVGAALYILRLGFQESAYPKRGSFDWYVTVSSLVRNVPTPGIEGDAKYYTSPGDGPKPPVDEITFQSNATEQQIRQQITTYVKAHGYAEEAYEDDPSIFAFRNTSEQTAVHLSMKPDAGKLTVKMTQYH